MHFLAFHNNSKVSFHEISKADDDDNKCHVSPNLFANTSFGNNES